MTHFTPRIFFTVLGILLLVSCKQGNLTHERYVQNNTAADTIVVINPDFNDAIDTIFPGDTAFIYGYQILDTEQESEPCKWLGDTLIIKNLDDEHLNRSVKKEDFWTYSISGGDQERVQRCIFNISTGDFE